MRALHDSPSLTAAGAVVFCLVLTVSLSVAPVSGSPTGASEQGDDRTTNSFAKVAGDSDSVSRACVDRPGVSGSQTQQDSNPVPVNESVSVGPSTVEADDTVPLGGIAVVSLSVPAGRESTVAVGTGTNHTVELAVEDDGDGEATLRVNTYLAANGTTVDPRAYTVTGVESARVRTEATDAPMTSRTYPVTVRRGDAAVDESQVTVTTADFGTVVARSAPPQLFDAGTLAALRTADELGVVGDPAPGDDDIETKYGETLVLRVDSPTLLGAFAAQPGETASEKFARLGGASEENSPVGIALTGPCVYVDLAKKAESGAVRPLPDYENDRLYLLVDTGRIDSYPEYGEIEVDIEPESPTVTDDRFLRFEQSSFEVPDGRPYIDRHGPSSVSYRQLADDIVQWPNSTYVEVSGESHELSAVTVSAQSLVDPTFETSRTVRFSDDEFTAPLNLSDTADSGIYKVTVANVTYTARTPDAPNVTWELAPPTDSTTVERLAIGQLRLEDGGFLVAYRPGPNASEFQRVGSAGTRDIALPVVPIDESQHLLVVAHRDGNDNGRFDGPVADPAYRVGDNVVREWIAVEPAGGELLGNPPAGSFSFDKVGEPPESLVTATPEPTETPTLEPTETPTQEPTETQTPEPTDIQSAAPTPSETATTAETAPSATLSSDVASNSTATNGGTTGDGPGFGLLLALVGLVLGAAGLSRRRT